MLDYILSVDSFPEDDSSSYVKDYKESFGGAAANAAYIAARLGAEVSLISLAGKDFPGSLYEKHLQESGVNLDIKIYDDYTAKAFIVNDSGMKQKVFFYWGASKNLPDLLQRVPSDGTLLLTAGHKSFSNIQHPNLVFDPGQDVQVYDSESMKQSLQNTKLLMPNETEWKIIQKLVGNVFDHGVETVVLTKGENGSEIITEKETIPIPALEANIADPTGCGDAYRAGFLVALEEGKDHTYCGRFASAVAAFVGEELGPQVGAPTREQAIERMRFYER